MLPTSCHHPIIISLRHYIEGVWIDKALIDSVLEGTKPAWVFTYDTLKSETVLMYCEHGDYIIMGNTIQGRCASSSRICRAKWKSSTRNASLFSYRKLPGETLE